MKKIANIIIRFLIICGAVYVLSAIILYVTVAFQVRDRTVDNDDQHVRFVLQWFGLSNDYEVKIEHSYKITGSWAGDYEKAFAIKLLNIEESEIIQRDGVIRGDKVTTLIRDDVETVMNFTDNGKMPWFPKREQILSNEFYIYPVSMVHNNIYPDSIHMMFIRPSDKMVFYYAYRS